MADKFVHLHVHTEYSLLDGLSKITDLVDHVKTNGMSSVAITDHGVMYGVIDFYKKVQKKGLKPIIGMEAYISRGKHTKKEKGKTKNYHLILLAKNEEGYKNLMKLTSIAHLEGFYYRPRFDRQTLEKHSKGLICTSACAQGELAQALIQNNYKEAEKTAQWYSDLFGKNYYLEMQRHHYSDFLKDIEKPVIKREVAEMADNEDKINKGIVKISRKLGIPLVATNDAHYIKKEDATAQDALVCIATGKNVEDTKRLRFIDTPSYHLAAPEEMEELFEDYPDALKNTVRVADKCDLKISTLGNWYFPKYPLPKGKDAKEHLKDLVYERLDKRVEKVTKEVKERIEYELSVINKKGYAPYFLIVMDMVNWANEQGIITNTRGSAAGSLVSFVLSITTVNPLKYYLPFERFLNPYRPSPPDIDFDVSDDRREEVIEYISEKYGKEKVAQICTFGRMLSRASVRDVARVLGYPYETGDKVAKLIPPPRQGFPIDIPKALQEAAELNNLYKSDPDAKKILDLAKQMEGNARHVSVHAAGVVVSPSDLTEFTPVQKEPSGEKIITQYEMHACEDVGLIKFDILGIRNLSILGSAIDKVERISGKRININTIPLDDKKTFKMLGKGDTMGVFQFSGSGMTRYLKDLKPERIEDLMAMVALYRPGPMAVIPEYIERKKDTSKVRYLDPRMKKFLEKSYGLIVYQDDLLFCALELAGYSWEEADKFRKAVGKKIPEEMAAQKEKFIKGVIENGQNKEFAEKIWELFEPFQAYGFNKAHAASYGMVAYYTAYMKANYPVEFMCALLTAESHDAEKISTAISECKRIGIKVMPPDINKSNVGFTIEEVKDSIEGKAIRFGLNAIKNVGSAAIKAILKERKESEFVSFVDFLSRVDNRKVNKRVVESLIKVGALSKYGNRATLLASLDDVRSKVSRPKGNKNQQGLFSTDEIKKSMKTKNAEVNNEIDEFSQEELQSLERQLMGLSLSAKPIHELVDPFRHFATHNIEQVTGEVDVNNSVKVAAVIAEVRVVVTKRSGREMAFVKIQDETGSISLVVFPKTYDEIRNILVDNKPILVEGKVDERQDERSLILDSIYTKETIDKKNNDHLFIRIPKDVDAGNLSKLKKVLINNPGRQKVTLIFEGQEGKKVSLNIKIKWNEQVSKKIVKALETELIS